jgi:hypothetical protein
MREYANAKRSCFPIIDPLPGPPSLSIRVALVGPSLETPSSAVSRKREIRFLTIFCKANPREERTNPEMHHGYQQNQGRIIATNPPPLKPIPVSFWNTIVANSTNAIPHR